MTKNTTEEEAPEYAIGLLTEEAGEINQMVGKWIRFGPDHARAKDGLTSRKGLSLEVGDILAAIEYGLSAGILDKDIVATQHVAKLTKLLDENSKDDQGNRLAPPVNLLRYQPTHDTETLMYLSKWVERGLFDSRVTPTEAMSVIAYYPSMPWKTGVWDVNHKPYAEEFYNKFPKAKPKE